VIVGQELKDSSSGILLTGGSKLSGYTRFCCHTRLAESFTHNAHGQIHHDGFALEILLFIHLHTRLPFKQQLLIQACHFWLKLATLLRTL
jgi:hypothetical protein